MDTKRLMAGTLAGFLMIGASPSTWANPPSSETTGANQAPATTSRADRSLLGMLAPILTDPAQHAPQKTCKPGTLYSAHDVVGDPDACFMGRLDGRSGTPNGFGRGY
jgi:hypothetical protein